MKNTALTTPIRLRPHHLLCMLTYVGKGYSPDFIANYDRLIPRLLDTDIVLVEGPDDICAPLLSDPCAHCLGASINARDTLALQDINHYLDRDLRFNVSWRLDQDMLTQLREEFRLKRIRRACYGCEWSPLCESVANDAYLNVKLVID